MAEKEVRHFDNGSFSLKLFFILMKNGFCLVFILMYTVRGIKYTARKIKG
jgi:hypothetical protein